MSGPKVLTAPTNAPGKQVTYKKIAGAGIKPKSRPVIAGTQTVGDALKAALREKRALAAAFFLRDFEDAI